MICYKDRAFCVSPGCVNECGRQLTPEVRAAAEAWWGEPGAPIAVGRFCDPVPEPTEEWATQPPD